MNARLKRRIKKAILVLLLIYVAGGVALYFTQDMIFFHPKALSRDHRFSFKQPFTELNIPFGKNNLNVLQFKPDNPGKGIVLFFHGNMENVEHYRQYPELFTRNNYEIWMIDYPGFGKSTGTITEDNLYKQAWLVYDLASKKVHGDSIIIYGKSIGTGIASYLAAKRNCKELVLETPYYSAVSLAKHYFPIYPVSILLKYSFPVCSYLREQKRPITILHGTNDEVVPYMQSERLKEMNKQINLVTIEKGRHNDLSSFQLFQTTLDSLLRN
jgi:alpha-beta hydrolase superfamily lysophospholipase